MPNGAAMGVPTPGLSGALSERFHEEQSVIESER
jgi:hypothetical protein